jgi:hypothetical protein
VPYGIKKALGGDTPAVDARMERCVKDLQAQGKSKIASVLICKASIQKSLEKKQKK